MKLKRKQNKAEKNYRTNVPEIIPKGTLLHLEIDQLKPSPNNPRGLFDEEPLKDLKESIRVHSVLVPLIVYKLPAQEIYSIIDGERRYRCCKELKEENVNIKIPVNIVETPDSMSSVIYMFNIHSFRESWELMPTALSLKKIIEDLEIKDDKELNQITGLSIPQIKRCKTILNFPEKYQKLSLEPDVKKRIPSNFWIELYPVLEIAKKQIPDIYNELGRDGITDKMVEKYKAKNIKSVIHFRRILEAFEVNEENTELVADRLGEYILTPELETRVAFDSLTGDTRRTRRVIAACDKFIDDITKSKIVHTIDDKADLIIKLQEVLKFASNLIETLKGEDAPEQESEL